MADRLGRWLTPLIVACSISAILALPVSWVFHAKRNSAECSTHAEGRDICVLPKWAYRFE